LRIDRSRRATARSLEEPPQLKLEITQTVAQPVLPNVQRSRRVAKTSMLGCEDCPSEIPTLDSLITSPQISSASPAETGMAALDDRSAEAPITSGKTVRLRG
jgi:hypothetical protein